VPKLAPLNAGAVPLTANDWIDDEVIGHDTVRSGGTIGDFAAGITGTEKSGGSPELLLQAINTAAPKALRPVNRIARNLIILLTPFSKKIRTKNPPCHHGGFDRDRGQLTWLHQKPD
jgi:hypothetical protein